ncbi:hypothetical protein E1200_30125 [Actinomadura sp. GC306]|uniref:hypothetical protein n=1 Tax=Actinomadura sp. GC306 TaxID=2530367 RepID=UPI00104392A1|nr:hypothetical protein [Actinomadura sp. GC306]TDC60640.1 hypothetical protein E1200_30125 [Actinomadura sp. GC306]
MRGNAEGDPRAYWRRRAIALAGVVGSVGLLAWACTGGGDEPVKNAGAVESASPPPPPTAMPTVTVTVTTTPEPEPARDGGPCDDKDLVFTLSTPKSTFNGSEHPDFRITVVNTGKASCAFDTGSLDVRITSGSDDIWSSAKCREGNQPKKTLKRGVPLVETITWNRKRGCGNENTRPGTYVADLKDKKAKKQIFHLR